MTPIPRYVQLIREGRFAEAAALYENYPGSGRPVPAFLRRAGEITGCRVFKPIEMRGHYTALRRALIACALDLAGYPHEADGPKEMK